MKNELQVPWLRAGTGSTPADGGCIMQVIDWLDRTGWSDSPECVHPVLRVLAIRANDALGDADRQQLLDLAPRLMGTNSDDRVLSVRLAAFCARYVLHIFEERYPGDERPRRAIDAAEAWAYCPCEYHAAAAAYAYPYTTATTAAAAAAATANAADANAADAAAIALLLAVLDEYDRLTGRMEVPAITAEQYAAVCEVMR